MTGFGQGQALAPEFQVEVTLRTLNGRFLDIRVRGLGEFPLLTHRVEEKLRAAFTRGTLEATVRLTTLPGQGRKKLDLELAKAYWADLQALGKALGLAQKPNLSDLLALGIFQEPKAEEELLWPAVEEALSQALAETEASRAREGEALRQILTREKNALVERLAQAEILAKEDQAQAQKQLRARVEELAGVDPMRLSAEMAILLSRNDVREELDRLRAHVSRLEELLSHPGPVGKELEFLAQELGREAGALAAKAHGPELSQLALELRLSAERLREQARNVE